MMKMCVWINGTVVVWDAWAAVSCSQNITRQLNLNSVYMFRVHTLNGAFMFSWSTQYIGSVTKRIDANCHLLIVMLYLLFSVISVARITRISASIVVYRPFFSECVCIYILHKSALNLYALQALRKNHIISTWNLQKWRASCILLRCSSFISVCPLLWFWCHHQMLVIHLCNTETGAAVWVFLFARLFCWLSDIPLTLTDTHNWSVDNSAAVVLQCI